MIFHTATWESENGFSVAFGPNRFPYVLKNITDTLGADAQIVKAPGQDGATTYAVSLGQPVINLVGSLHAIGETSDERRKRFDQLQDELTRAFRPNSFGVLTDYRPSTPRMIRCRPIAKPTFGPYFGGSCTIDIEFLADLPHWTATEETMLSLGQEVGMFRFPLRLPTLMGLYTKTGFLTNDFGDPVWPIIEIFTASEYVAVKNLTSGKMIEINRAIGEGQKLVVDTANTRVSLWELDEFMNYAEIEDVSNWVSLQSEYWPLEPGVNEIQVSNEIAGEDVVSIIRFFSPV